MKKMPKNLILSCLALSLLTLGFSSWVFGGTDPSFNVDVGSSSVFDPSSIFSLNSNLGKGGIEGIKYSVDNYGLLDDGIFGNTGNLVYHIRINIKEISSLINKADNSFSFKVMMEYFNPAAIRQNDYLSSSILKGCEVTTSYMTTKDEINDSTLTNELSPITYKTSPSSVEIPSIKIKGIDYTHYNPQLSTADNANGYRNFIYLKLKFRVETTNNSKEVMDKDRGDGSKVVVKCGMV